ncbi:MAG: hypothetical protein C0417_06235 [Chlorobiaceae bacterium]|nr:hypothetical protein [Chlorobiaceae bacterium]
MVSSFKYRLVVFILTGIFSVFNIGLPVVLHYCKMMETLSSNSCGMCDTDKMYTGNIQISKAESSCCKAVLGVDRNKSEFLQTQKDEVTKLQQSITPILHASLTIAFESNFKILLNSTHSPPLTEDIPIFTSSLLI